MKGWWEGMDLASWCVEAEVGSSDFAFALALANERAGRRGIRQLVTRNTDFAVSPFAWLVTDIAQPRLLAVSS